jgi:hypothetical protein
VLQFSTSNRERRGPDERLDDLFDPFGETFEWDREWRECARLLVFLDADDEQTAVDREGRDIVGQLPIRAPTAWQLSLEVELVMLGVPPFVQGVEQILGRVRRKGHRLIVSRTVLVGADLSQGNE